MNDVNFVFSNTKDLEEYLILFMYILYTEDD